MEVLEMSTEIALVIGIIGFVVGAVAIYQSNVPNCCDKFDCNQGRDCPYRKEKK